MRLLTYSVLMVLLTGCGEVSYKRGGSPQDIERAHSACRGSGDQLSACLAQHGWQTPKVDAFDPLFATIEATDNREATQAKPSPFIEVTPAPNSAPPETARAAAVAPASAIPKPGEPAPKSQAMPVPAAVVTAAPVTTESAPPVTQRSTAQDGPEVQYSINSWWKMGGFPQQLKADQQTCEQRLGKSYLPDYKTQTYKRAFVVCMHDLGWMAIRNLK